MGQKLTEQDWEKVRQEYVSSRISQKGLCKKYGIPNHAIIKRCRDENWVEQRERFAQSVVRKANDELVNEHCEMYKEACRISRRIMEKINNALDAMDILPGSELKAYTGAIKDMREMGMFRADLDRKEQEARIRKLQKDAEEESKDMSITVTFQEDDYGD